MSFTKKEAIFYLAHQMGSVDGEFSDEEQNHLVVLSSYYRDNLNSMDSELLLSGIRNGTLN